MASSSLLTAIPWELIEECLSFLEHRSILTGFRCVSKDARAISLTEASTRSCEFCIGKLGSNMTLSDVSRSIPGCRRLDICHHVPFDDNLRMPNLRHLYLRYVAWTRLPTTFISTSSRLRELILDNARLEGIDARIAQHLHKLSIWQNTSLDIGTTLRACGPELRQLKIEDTSLSCSFSELLLCSASSAFLSSLTDLDLSCCHQIHGMFGAASNDDDESDFFVLSNLKKLSLEHTRVTNIHARSVPMLEECNLMCTRFIDWNEMFQEHNVFRHVRFFYCDIVSEHRLPPLWTTCLPSLSLTRHQQ